MHISIYGSFKNSQRSIISPDKYRTRPLAKRILRARLALFKGSYDSVAYGSSEGTAQQTPVRA